MIDVMSFFVKTIVSSLEKPSYYFQPLESISTDNGRFAYVDDRKKFSKNILQSLIENSTTGDFIEHLLFGSRPSKLKPVTLLLPKVIQSSSWDRILEKRNSLSASQQTKLCSTVRKNFVNVLKGKDEKKRNELLSAISGIIFSSRSDNFPDFMFPSSMKDNELYDGSIFELKDSRGSNISSFNSTLPTQWKSLEEITKLNGNDNVSRLATLVDFPESLRDDYKSYKRRCFYFVRTNNKNDHLRISLVEGSFFETMPKENLIGETIKAIARDHFGIRLTPELEKSFEMVNDQSLIAKSRGDLRAIVNGIEKRASVSPRFRIMSEVTSDGNPHLYSEIPSKTFNLVLQVSPSRERNKQYNDRKKYLISLMSETANDFMGGRVSYDENTDRLIANRVNITIKEIAHNRNGLHLVFQHLFA